jgi:hypothetical protein
MANSVQREKDLIPPHPSVEPDEAQRRSQDRGEATQIQGRVDWNSIKIPRLIIIKLSYEISFPGAGPFEAMPWADDGRSTFQGATLLWAGLRIAPREHGDESLKRV